MQYNNSPEAVFDTLYVGSKLQSSLGDFSMYEVQFFSYFSCLLFIYDGHAATDWNYGFIKATEGSPYSMEIKNALEINTANGALNNVNGYFQITPKGFGTLSKYTTHILSLKERAKYIDAACSCVALMPIGLIKDAINNDPIMSSANLTQDRESLFQSGNPATASLYKQFQLLKTALKDRYADLLVPAFVWIESLNNPLKNQLPQ